MALAGQSRETKGESTDLERMKTEYSVLGESELEQNLERLELAGTKLAAFEKRYADYDRVIESFLDTIENGVDAS